MPRIRIKFIEQFKKRNQEKKNRRTASEIEKNHMCPYEGCNKLYGSDVSLNLHIKLKHNGGNKTEREKLARSIFLAKLNGEKVPDISLNLPPGFLENVSANKILKEKGRDNSNKSMTSSRKGREMDMSQDEMTENEAEELARLAYEEEDDDEDDEEEEDRVENARREREVVRETKQAVNVNVSNKELLQKEQSKDCNVSICSTNSN